MRWPGTNSLSRTSLAGHDVQRVGGAGFVQPVDGAVNLRQRPLGKGLVVGDAVVLRVAPDGLAPAVVLLRLREEVAVGLLRFGKEVEILAGDLRVAGDVVAVHDVGAVAQIEGVVVELVDGLDVVGADVVAGDEVVDEVGVEGIDGLLLGQADLHALGENLVPEGDDLRLGLVEAGLLDGGEHAGSAVGTTGILKSRTSILRRAGAGASR